MSNALSGHSTRQPAPAAFRIRTAVEADIPALAKVIELAMRTTVAQAYQPRQVECALQYLVGVDSRLIADGAYYVAEANRRIVGGGGWSRRKALYGGDTVSRPDGAEQLRDPARDPAKMRVFFMHPEWARHGADGQSGERRPLV